MANQNTIRKPMGIKKIRNASTPYKDGGVLEASKFSKGDGWKDITSRELSKNESKTE